jgi:hypothetical protein
MLVKEIQDKIYEFLNLYEIEKKKVIHQLNMIIVWRNHIMYNCQNKFSDIMLNKIFFLSCNDWIWLYNKSNRKNYIINIKIFENITNHHDLIN